MTPEELDTALDRNAQERRVLTAEYTRRHQALEPMPESHFVGWSPDHLKHHVAFDHDADLEEERAARDAMYATGSDALANLHRRLHG